MGLGRSFFAAQIAPRTSIYLFNHVVGSGLDFDLGLSYVGEHESLGQCHFTLVHAHACSSLATAP